MLFLVLVLFIKPEDIPKVFQTLGQWYGNLRRLYIGVSDEFRDLSYSFDTTKRESEKELKPKTNQHTSSSEETFSPLSFKANFKDD